jgi:hypothetical protein
MSVTPAVEITGMGQSLKEKKSVIEAKIGAILRPWGSYRLEKQTKTSVFGL